MAEVEPERPSSSSQEVEHGIFSSKEEIFCGVSLILAELLSIGSLFLPWFSIKMSIPLMGLQMNGTYDFFLFSRMRISIEGLPGTFAGAVASKETILAYVHPLFWSPLIGTIVGLWPLMKLFRKKPYHKQAIISAVLITLIALEMKFLSINIGKEALSDFLSLMASLGAELSFSSHGSDLFLISGAFMLFSQVPNAIKMVKMS